MPVPTFALAMSESLRDESARPFATFYDDATGERIELSLATYANWVNKTAGLVRDELDVERGALILLDLPPHWLGAVWLGAAWTMGLCVTDDRALVDRADLVVCGPDRLEEYAALADRLPVVALSLRPLGGRFLEALPEGVVDYGAVVLAQPDVFVPDDEPSGEDAAWRGEDADVSQAELLQAAREDRAVARRGRLLTDVNPCSRPGLVTLLSPLLEGAGTVWVAHGDPGRWQHRYDEERATDELRASVPS